MTKAAISGTFTNVKTIPSRKVCQLVVEVPIEQADEALRTLGGFPNPAEERWVAIALMSLEPKPEPAPVEGKRKWEEMPPSQQAAIRCGEPEFRAFLADRSKTNVLTGEEAAQRVRNYCAVESRAELNTSAQAAKAWRELDDAFFKWQRGMR